MADYWKSNPRKFCDFCQCWFADNKSSREFHERGKRHKENVEKKIGELRKKGQKQYETQQQLSGFLKQMEEGAMSAFKKDVAANPNLIPEYKVALVENRVRQEEETPTSSLPGSRYDPSPAGTSAGTNASSSLSSSAAASTSQGQSDWVEALSPEGHTYYWNTKTAVTQWEKPENFTPLTSSAKKGESSDLEDEDDDKKKGDSSESDGDEAKKEKTDETSRGTKRKNDAYGGWSTVSTGAEETTDLQLPESNPLYMSSYVPQAVQFEPKEKLVIKEKIVGSISTGPRDKGGNVAFKKRKGGSRQIRSRDATS